MPQPLTIEQLKSYQDRIDNGGLEQVRQVYGELYKKGYNYAGWALGVANGKTMTGLAALEFLKGTALMGLDIASCRNLSQSTIDVIRYGMGKSYITALINAAGESNDGYLNRDVHFDETREFHRKVFGAHGLTLANWTLHTPMELIRQTEGSAAVETLWQRMRDTGGDGLDGVGAGMMLLNKVGQLLSSPDAGTRQRAAQWMETVPGVANLKQMGKSIELLWTSMQTEEDSPAEEGGSDGWAMQPFKLVLDPVDGQTKIVVNTRPVFDPDVAEGPDTYVVQKGDSLWKIAIDNGWDYNALLKANAHLSNPDFIRVGQRIQGLPSAQPERAVQDTNLRMLLDAEYRMHAAHQAGQVGAGSLQSFSDWAVQQLGGVGLRPGGGVGLHLGGGVGLRVPGVVGFDPIGAFYESVRTDLDQAASIALRTPVLMDAAGRGLTAGALQALDRNGDGQLAGKEVAALTLWTDVNEDGMLDEGERRPAAARGTQPLRATDYAIHARRSGALLIRPRAVPERQEETAGQPLRSNRVHTVPDSGYRKLRDTDTHYTGYDFVITWKASDIKVDSRTATYLIGTDGNDHFDANFFVNYPNYFNSKRLVNFLGGDGDDLVGGSIRADRLWGGIGHDVLFGADGHDQLFGEQDDDTLQGGTGNDSLDGGIGSDLMFGEVGNDLLFGGEGDDLMVGFVPSDAPRQTLALRETDDDALYGGNGADELQGGLGNDSLDGGADDDKLFGQDGNDTAFGGAGHDLLQGGFGNDQLLGDDGDDRQFGEVGDDRLWGGAGHDVLVGFTGSDDPKQQLATGETDNDQLIGEAGDDQLYGGLGTDYLDGGDDDDLLNGGEGADTLFGGAHADLMFGGLDDDLLYGEADNDELQGGDGNDGLYGGQGDDRLFGQLGNDLMYGGEGNDLLVGFTGTNEERQSLAAGESDGDWLYGGAGSDLLAGGVGDDYLDGGAGSDEMEGGQGDDIFVVNSVNDVVFEKQLEGHDTVVSSVSYLLNANVEELHLLEGFAIHGTGNALNNLIVGNGDSNILDGVTGADTMIGGFGNDTYYVDDALDRVVERAGQGTDTVQSKISVTLGEQVEHLNLLDFSKPEKGLIDGRAVLVYGYPKANELDYLQGDAIPDYLGTCALTSIANLLTQARTPTTEAEVVQLAIDRQWAVTDPAAPAYQRGGSNYQQQQALLDSYGMRNALLSGYDEHLLANLLCSGRGVLVALNSGKLWSDPAYVDDGGVNHVVTVTGVALSAENGLLQGFYIADSGRRRVSDMTRFVSIEEFRQAAAVPNAYAIYTKEAIKLWNEDIDGHGNALGNSLIGNRGNNVLEGAGGNDTLYGGAGQDVLMGGVGGDTYVFNRGDGCDLIRDAGVAGDSPDLLRFGQGINQADLWYRQIADDLEISLYGTSDSLRIEGWYASPFRRIEQIQTGDGLALNAGQVDALVSAMAMFESPLAPALSPANSFQQTFQHPTVPRFSLF